MNDSAKREAVAFCSSAVFLKARSLEGIHRQFQERGLPAPTEIGLCVFALFVRTTPVPWFLKFARVFFPEATVRSHLRQYNSGKQVWSRHALLGPAGGALQLLQHCSAVAGDWSDWVRGRRLGVGALTNTVHFSSQNLRWT